MDAGPSLPQPTKVEQQGTDYWWGRGVREAPDTDMTVCAWGGKDLDRTDAQRDKIDPRRVAEVTSVAASSGDASAAPSAEVASMGLPPPAPASAGWLNPYTPSVSSCQPTAEVGWQWSGGAVETCSEGGWQEPMWSSQHTQWDTREDANWWQQPEEWKSQRHLTQRQQDRHGWHSEQEQWMQGWRSP